MKKYIHMIANGDFEGSTGNILKFSVIAVVFVTLFSLMVYGTMQQMLRLGANVVPVQLAGDVINKIESGASVMSVVLPEKIEISKSLSPFVLILDQNKKVLASSATLDGAIPVIPSGIFDWVAKSGQDRVTWQPRIGIREALIIDKYSVGEVPGFVVAGASLKESESAIDKIGKDIFIGWIIVNAFAITSITFLEVSRKK